MSQVVFQGLPVGADIENTVLTGDSGQGSGIIDLSPNETEVITFNLQNEHAQDTPTFFIEQSPSAGQLVLDDADTGIYTYTITYAEWIAAGSPASVTMQFDDDFQTFFMGEFIADSDPARYTLSITCFAAGTRIATPEGTEAVEVLSVGNLICTEDDRHVPVKWIGRQTLSKGRHGPHMQPVCIRAGALGGGLPLSDLTVTADHGMVLNGYVVNASALVNGHSIDFVPIDELQDTFTVYHIETDRHDVILANGAPSESFIDAAGRAGFDNHHEYLDLYGAERIIPEMDRPRISSRRLLPAAIKAQLGHEPAYSCEVPLTG